MKLLGRLLIVLYLSSWVSVGIYFTHSQNLEYINKTFPLVWFFADIFYGTLGGLGCSMIPILIMIIMYWIFTGKFFFER